MKYIFATNNQNPASTKVNGIVKNIGIKIISPKIARKKKNGIVTNCTIPIANVTKPKIENKGDIIISKTSQIAIGIEKNKTIYE